MSPAHPYSLSKIPVVIGTLNIRLRDFLANRRGRDVEWRGPIVLTRDRQVINGVAGATGFPNNGSTDLEEPPGAAVPAERHPARTMSIVIPAAALLFVLALFGPFNNAGAIRVPASFMSLSVPMSSLREQADRLLARRDFAAAETAYRTLLKGEPANLALRYSLGVTLSHLDRLSETAEQFQWIVEHGNSGREEVVSARQWLNSLAPSHEAAGAPGESTAVIDSVALGSMKGRTVWPGITRETRLTPLELVLVGDEPATAGKTMRVHMRLGAPYRVSKIPAGVYRLTARAEGRDLWKTQVVIAADTATVLDLTPETSLLTPEQFPPRESS